MPAFLGRAALALALTATFALALASAAAAAAPADPAAPPPSEMPSCAEGPERVGDEVLGTPCDDRIVAPASVAAVYGGAGDDVIVGANSGVATAASGDPLSAAGLHLEVGSQTFEGGAGNDTVFGDRGNDTLRGNAGNDRLYGGIGDDVLEGGEGDDLLAGGFGADKIDGQSGNDYVRGDATIDRIFDSGGGFDTLSFATAASPGFTGTDPTKAAGFPPEGGERGVYLELNTEGNNALDGEPSLGGGNDEVQANVFERIIGSPFSDYIVGGALGEQIFGGGGADVIEGGEGDDFISGGADGDYLDGGPGSNTIEAGAGDHCVNPSVCGNTTRSVKPRSAGTVGVGLVTAGTGFTGVYAVGTENGDSIAASYTGSSVLVTIAAGAFDSDLGGCEATGSPTTVSCPVSGLLDAVLLAGKGGNDTLSANVPDGTTVVELGGEGADQLNGSASEDILVDGPGAGADVLAAGFGDDALTHNGGPDLLDGGEGSDLFLSVSICDGETIDGGAERVGAATPDRDNASWARLGGIGVDARLDQGRVGRIGANEEPVCPGGSFDTLSRIEDLEASNQSDVLYGNEGDNQLLGHQGEDTYFALGGNDSILANSGSRDRVINCGPGLDQAVIDLASVGDPTPIECERVREGAAGEFEELPLLSEPTPPPPPAPPPPPPPAKDRKPPQTKLLRHPAKLLRVAPRQRRLVSFRFAASEKSSFRCKLDRRPYAACRSPRKFKVAVGRHVFRLFAIDAAGNRDRTPAVFQFRVVARKH